MLDAILIQATSMAAALIAAMALRPRPLSLAPMTVALLHVLFLQAWMLALGLTIGFGFTQARITAATIGIATTLFVATHRSRLAREWTLWQRRSLRTSAVLGRCRLILIPCALAVMAILVATVGLMTGPYLPDVTAYHLVPSADWVTHGGIATHNWIDPRAWWPQGHGLLMTAWMLPFSHLDAAPLAGLHALALTWAVAWALGRQMGGSVRAVALGTGLLIAVPILWAQPSSCLNDLLMSALALSGVAAVAGRRVDTRHVLIAATAILMGLGVKPTLLLLAPPVLLVAARRWWIDGRPDQPHKIDLPWVFTILASLITGIYWYARNAWVLPDHNPLYPSSLKLFGIELWAGHPDLSRHHGQFSFTQLSDNLLNLFTRIGWDSDGFSGAQTEHSTGWGPLAMGLGWAAAAALACRVPRSRPALALLILMMTFMGLGIEADWFHGRMYAYVPIVLVACVALAGARLRGKTARSIWAAMVALSASGSIVMGLCGTAPEPVLRQWWTARAIHPLIVPEPFGSDLPFVHAVHRLVPPDSPLVVVADDFRHGIALLHGPRLTRPLIYRGRGVNTDSITRWRDSGVRWVCLAMPHDMAKPHAALLSQAGLIDHGGGLYEFP